jgi:anti-sigma regulatory factor (Ser/Thr protein kinase)
VGRDTLMFGFRTTIRHHVDLDVTAIEATGTLSAVTAPDLLETVGGATAECPSSVLLDLSGCEIQTPAVLTPLAGVGQPDKLRPSVQLIVVAALAVPGVLAVDSYRAAIATATAQRARHPVVRLDFDAFPGAPAQARDVVRATCEQWGAAVPASEVELVASELVTNAVLYGQTAGRMELISQDGFLRLRVTDGSAEPPLGRPFEVPAVGTIPSERGRGLPLVELLSADWGYLIDADGRGKVVWATFPERPRAA